MQHFAMSSFVPNCIKFLIAGRGQGTGVNTTFSHIGNWNEPSATGHPYLTPSKLHEADTSRPITLWVKGIPLSCIILFYLIYCENH